jgi:lipoprotein-anchoring transpeptidase ErfK/SrfK
MYSKYSIKTLGKIVMLLLTIQILTFCSKRATNTSADISDSIRYNENSKLNERKTKQTVNVSYSYDTLHDKENVKSFIETYNKNQINIIAAINRIDPDRIKVGEVLVIPNPLVDSLSLYMPFPTAIDAIAQYPKVILVNQRIQAFAAYENGVQIRTAPVSSGKKSTPTPNGLYHTNFKAKRKTSTVNGNWVMPWYFNIDNKLGIALHEYDLPGYPASHSCVRLYEDDAKWFYDWGKQWKLSNDGSTVIEQGTPVLVFGEYNFDTIQPWKLLPQNNKVLELTAEELGKINSSF